MTDQRHPDIEIYLKSCTITDIESWLSTLGDLTVAHSNEQTHQYQLTIGKQSMDVMIHERVAGKAWCSLWFKSNHTSWSQDLACAQAASEALNAQVRCVAGGWSDGDDPDEYWKVENGNTETIIWRS